MCWCLMCSYALQLANIALCGKECRTNLPKSRYRERIKELMSAGFGPVVNSIRSMSVSGSLLNGVRIHHSGRYWQAFIPFHCVLPAQS